MPLNQPKDNDHDKLNIVLTRILVEMDTYGPDSPEYAELLSHLERVVVLRASREKRTFSPDAILTATTYLFGILIIVAYEQKHALTSKAVGFIRTLK